ncbi:hypothetical protein TNCV_3424261 [Trichonephila clavipes]|nr:hypothetical protein TNCV_3424261 [Trichonephila clavipes]
MLGCWMRLSPQPLSLVKSKVSYSSGCCLNSGSPCFKGHRSSSPIVPKVRLSSQPVSSAFEEKEKTDEEGKAKD